MELTLGPVLFEWGRDALLRFYEEVAEMPVDRVYLGEVVCVKKNGLGLKDLEEVGRALEAAGKKVAVSTLAVVSNDEELGFTRDLLSLPFTIEANDVSVFEMAEEITKAVAGGQEKTLFAGPHIKTYNPDSVEFLRSIGIKRITFPVELSGKSVRHNIEATGMEGMEAEVFAHGKVPLAFSWRCYTERAYGLTKDECRRHCAEYPEGMELKSLNGEKGKKGEDVFAVNGTSVLSARPVSLIEQTEELQEMGVTALRISPGVKHTALVSELFKKRIDRSIGAEEAMDKLRATTGLEYVNGFYHGRAGKDSLTGDGDNCINGMNGIKAKADADGLVAI